MNISPSLSRSLHFFYGTSNSTSNSTVTAEAASSKPRAFRGLGSENRSSISWVASDLSESKGSYASFVRFPRVFVTFPAEGCLLTEPRVPECYFMWASKLCNTQCYCLFAFRIATCRSYHKYTMYIGISGILWKQHGREGLYGR